MEDQKDNPTDQNTLLKQYVTRILKLIRPLDSTVDYESTSETANAKNKAYPRLLQVCVPPRTQELLILAVSDDGQLTPMNIKEVNEISSSASNQLEVYTIDKSIKVQKNSLITYKDNDTVVSHRSPSLPILTTESKLVATPTKSGSVQNPGNSESPIKSEEESNIQLNDSPMTLESPIATIKSPKSKVVHCVCKVCKVPFSSAEAYRAHMCDKKMTTFKCRVCLKQFSSSKLLAVHSQSHLPKLAMKPTRRGSYHLADLQQELRRVESYVCDVCGDKFPTFEIFSQHKKMKHKLDHVCDTCHLSYQSSESLEMHKQGVHNAKSTLPIRKVFYIFKCVVCEKKFTSIENLQKHDCPVNKDGSGKKKKTPFAKDKNNPNQERVRIKEFLKSNCPTVEENEKNDNDGNSGGILTVSGKENDKEKTRIIKSTDLKERRLNLESIKKRFKRSKPMGAYCCDRCNRTFVTQDALESHKSYVHNPLRCGSCKEAFESTDQLALHQRGSCQENKTCGQCGKTFDRHHKLRKHMIKHQADRPYHCTLCTSKFKSGKALLCHMQTHREKQFLCHICSKPFTYRHHLSRHLKSHSTRRGKVMTATLVYHCYVCDCSYTALTKLREHYGTSHPLPAFNCVTCKVQFNDLDSLHGHVRTNHKGAVMDMCRLCGDTFVDKVSFKDHLSRHEIPVEEIPELLKQETEASPDARDKRVEKMSFMYSCTICNKYFATPKGLVTHNQVHYLEEPLQCFFCDQSLPGGSELDAHVLEHEKSVKLEKCLDCGKFVANLHLHGRVTHIRCTPQYPCTVCGKVLKTRRSLLVHSYLHTGEKPYCCPICSRRFNSFSKLEIHGRVHGTYDRPASYSCSYCKRKYIRHSLLLLHLYGIHKEPCTELRHICSYCEREFSSQSNLSNHLRTHYAVKASLKKDYACTKCNRTFTTKAHQLIHVRSHETDDLSCPNCSMTFKTLAWLQYHMRIHTGESAVCPICEKRFGSERNMKKHMESHVSNSQTRTQCPLCECEFATLALCVRHLKDGHSDVKPGLCMTCGSGFKTQEALQQHATYCGKFEDDSVGGGTASKTTHVTVTVDEPSMAGKKEKVLDLEDIAQENEQESDEKGGGGEGPEEMEGVQEENDTKDEESLEAVNGKEISGKVVDTSEVILDDRVGDVLDYTGNESVLLAQPEEIPQYIQLEIPEGTDISNIPLETLLAAGANENVCYQIVFQ